MGVRKTTVIGVAALFVFLQSLAFADQITDRARLLLQQKNPRAAYRLLEPLESQRAGDPEYDYLLGIAALDSGERERAVFALERVLAVNPKHAQARAEIARAYFEMGEKENAKREFENVRASNPPEAVKQTIDRYLSALEAGPTRFSGFVELGFGHDSNVNSATSANQIAIPALGGIVAALAPSGVKQSDNFATAGGAAPDLSEKLIEPYLKEAQAVVAEGIVADADLADAGLIFGTGFAPFRGGPLNYLATLRSEIHT